eukprot:c12914_g1_i1.p1 GENE.c12914_g1_i1~~c12914_g1_i1.p1  ORF type:complete len:261 (+),score=105.29 c12914_g1_i1:46-828(+)
MQKGQKKEDSFEFIENGGRPSSSSSSKYNKVDEDIYLGLDDDEIFSVEEIQRDFLEQSQASTISTQSSSYMYTPQKNKKKPSTRVQIKPKAIINKSNQSPKASSSKSKLRETSEDEELLQVGPIDDTSFCQYHPHNLAHFQCSRCRSQFCNECAMQYWCENNPKEAAAYFERLKSERSRRKKPWSKSSDQQESDNEHSNHNHNHNQPTKPPVLRCFLCAKSKSWKRLQFCTNLFIFIFLCAILILSAFLIFLGLKKYKKF